MKTNINLQVELESELDNELSKLIDDSKTNDSFLTNKIEEL